ncbi:sterile alpha motif domain-containing 9-like protein [Labeo rohita]|uniref:Sterile alpha motif domain-containing 9-like protein n=1 Tax=Labeo rohita TaxID=84645 RepID=A0A498LDG1_LABRO|nr:sterile alpha motif domain-containing 9-like protein [Labeo rohita]
MSSIPSSKNGIITIPTELRDSLSCLDIVCSDIFETGDPEEAKKHEADFLKGAPLKWINLAEDENSPMVKRDGFNDLIELIKRKTNKPCLITDVSLRYQSGSGGSTLAMQVLWHFRKDLRCARVIDSDLDTKELSKQVVDLFLLSNEKHTKPNRKTVLLLLDTRKKINDLPIKNIIWEDLIDEIQKRRINTETPAVIILNCIPTDFTLTDTMILPPKLSEEEIKKFKEKLLQQIRLQKKGHWKVTTINLFHHKDSGGSALAREVLSELREEFTCETLTEPFKTDIAENKDEFARETLKDELFRVYETHQNTVLLLLDHKDDKPLHYLIKSLQSKLQRADQTDHPAFIIINAVSKSVVRAKDNVKLKMELLPEEKDRFAQKKEEIKQKNMEMSQTFHAFNIMQGGFQKKDAEDLITKAMVKYVKNHEEFSSTRLLSFLALINSYVPGSHLSKLFCEEFMDQTEQPTDEGNPTLETIMKPFMDLIVIFSEGDQKVKYIRLAHPMIAHACLKMLIEHKVTRFDIAQDFLNSLVKEDNKYEEARKWAEEAINRDPENSHIRDTLGQVHKNHLLHETGKPSSDINVCKIIHPKTSLNRTPLEHIEQEHREFISSLKGDVETKYDFFEWYLAFSRQSFEKEDPNYIQKEVEECYMYYFKMDKQADKITLDKNKNNYSGELLYILKSDISVFDQYKSKIEKPQPDSESQTVLYILANIICSDSGEQFEKIKEFQARLQKLWLREMQDRRPEFYLLILLLFWPDDVQPAITNPPNLEKCVRKMRHSYKSKYQKYLRGRYLLPLFFLAKQKGLQRLIYTLKLSQTDLERLTEGDGSEEIKDLQRINGQVRDHKVFAITGEKQIQVTPHDRASVCKQGQVSFYLGFNIRGPVAYNIRYKYSFEDYYVKKANERIKQKN